MGLRAPRRAYEYAQIRDFAVRPANQRGLGRHFNYGTLQTRSRDYVSRMGVVEAETMKEHRGRAAPYLDSAEAERRRGGDVARVPCRVDGTLDVLSARAARARCELVVLVVLGRERELDTRADRRIRVRLADQDVLVAPAPQVHE